jgi:putative ABC transport system ATP-binding protein
MMGPLLEATELTVGPSERPLLCRAHLSVQRGECVALRGASGCGKTSLLRVLATLSEPAEGQLTLEGRSPASWGYPTWRRRVTYVSQRPVMFAGSVLDNLQWPERYRTAAGPADPGLADDWLERLGLAGFRDADTARLSVGEQQRVALLRALLIGPRVLLLDEPTSALDPERVEAVEALVRQYVESSEAAVLVVTHDTAQTARWCSRTLEFASLTKEGPAPHQTVANV